MFQIEYVVYTFTVQNYYVLLRGMYFIVNYSAFNMIELLSWATCLPLVEFHFN